MAEKKATDILVELLSGIEEIKSQCRSISFTNKLIVDRLNKLENLQSINKTVQKTHNIDNDAIMYPTQQLNKLTVSLPDNITVQPKNTDLTDDDYQFNQVSDVNSKLTVSAGADLHPVIPSQVASINVSAPTSIQRQAPKVATQQTISYADGNDNVIRLATVEINDSLGNLVKRTRTNASGKWTALLSPGVYIVSINRKEKPPYPAVSDTYQITVKSSEFPLELDGYFVK